MGHGYTTKGYNLKHTLYPSTEKSVPRSFGENFGRRVADQRVLDIFLLLPLSYFLSSF
jgi:hypothetical protein